MRFRFLSFFFLLGVVILTGASCVQFGSTATGPMGVYRSGDKGDSWQAVFALPTAKGVSSIAGLKVYRLFNDPGDPNAYYLGTRGQGLYFTYDYGGSWQAVPFFAGKFIYGLAVDPKDKCTIYASDGPHIYKSVDCSRSWSIVYTEERPNERLTALAVDYGNSAMVYGAAVGGDILMSENGGRSWHAVKRFGFELRDLAADPRAPGRVYVAALRDGLWRTDDAGEHWSDLSKGLNNFSDSKNFYRLIVNPGQKNSVFWISRFGILRSDDAGNVWVDLKLLTPPGSVNIYSFAINPDNQKEMYYTGTILGEKNVHVRSTFYKTVDGGLNWVTKKLPTNTIPTVLLIHPEKTSVLLLGFTLLD